MVVDRLRRALARLRPRYLPQSALGQAIAYALNQWPQLVGFLAHGEVELDNNLVENAIRPTALGKNYAQVSVMRSSQPAPLDRLLIIRADGGPPAFAVSA